MHDGAIVRKNWRDISYLQGGTERQRSAYASLRESRVLEILRDYDPVLVSTVCVDLDIPSSDLDVICEARDLEAFSTFLSSTFGTFRGFSIRRSDRSQPAIVAQFFFGSWEYRSSVKLFRSSVRQPFATSCRSIG